METHTLSDKSIIWDLSNIHRDDIHGIVQLGDSHLVSGSKDGSLVKISLEGKVVCSLEPRQKDGKLDYRTWMTAIARLNASEWVYGTRDGWVDLFDNDLCLRQSWHLVTSHNHQSKERNLDRIMCFGVPNASLDSNLSFMVGQATQFCFMKATDSVELTRKTYSASKNDWVYVLHPLSQKKMLVVTGTDLAVWEKGKGQGWEGSFYIVLDNSRDTKGFRPYISSLTEIPIRGVHQVACAFFGGMVSIYDYETAAPVISWHEHKERVWSVINNPLNPFVLATSADDKTVKLWDIRAQHSVFTTKPHIGRVSSLIAIEHRLVAATCPTITEWKQGGSLICRDLRMLS